ncbi:SDR family NAD(P)-dependent oxidoreductase [Shewanella sp. SG44-6]|uniref:SDR family NAD(P)-dependent oxidoreductase n=1 Tax=Shewanella sp. SG44-6 TaxID=2760959 RepID=UPI00160407D2|nr:SDR family NAD(P)-dependent oxidoreductase [Shewanella sp. SG44-6]MBB1390232.1 SDR family NAD(P)-dependent oxidoreductase [Shewanella sp. SG44-6]|tara:strand:- start:2071 stop:2838 length:768 start_codon:yes stop_codon:yes gene_type:complete
MSKIVVITGASSGIGFQLSKTLLLSESNILVIAIGRRGNMLSKLQALFPKKVLTIEADIASPDGRKDVVSALSQYSKIDCLVHSAATVHPLNSIKKLKLDDWRKSQQTNVEAPLFLTQLLINKFNNSRVLFITSEPIIHPVFGASSYCVSKAGQQMVYECFKAEFPINKVAFCLVSPGMVDTPMQEQIRQADPNELPMVEAISALYADNKLLVPSVVADFLKWLLLTVDVHDFNQNIWDIYEEKHHSFWLNINEN